MTTEPTEAPISDDDFLKVCGLLNAAGVRYLIAGGFAVMLHQVPTFTADVDVLIEESEDNYLRVIEALSHLMDGAALSSWNTPDARRPRLEANPRNDATSRCQKYLDKAVGDGKKKIHHEPS